MDIIDPDVYNQQGDTLLKENNLQESLAQYTKAIQLSIELTFDTNKLATYYSNRAQVHFMLNNFDFVINDCNDSLQQNKQCNDPFYAAILNHFFHFLWRKCFAFNIIKIPQQPIIILLIKRNLMIPRNYNLILIIQTLYILTKLSYFLL